MILRVFNRCNTGSASLSAMESKWTQSIAVGDKPFVEQVKERLGIRAKGRKIHESGDGYQLSERQALYGDWHDADTENTFDWNLAI